MTLIAVLLGVVVAAGGFVAIEKKRVNGVLTYPLWQGNLFIPWALFAAFFALLIGSFILPRTIGIKLHPMTAEATVTETKGSHHCDATYRYTVKNVSYTDSDSECGLKAGDVRTIYYDAQTPQNTTLYFPDYALQNQLIAIGILCFCLPTVLVLWFMSSHVIGRRKKT